MLATFLLSSTRLKRGRWRNGVCFKLWGGLDLSQGFCRHAGVSGLALIWSETCTLPLYPPFSRISTNLSAKDFIYRLVIGHRISLLYFLNVVITIDGLFIAKVCGGSLWLRSLNRRHICFLSCFSDPVTIRFPCY